MVLIDFERVNEPAKIVIFQIVNEPQHRASFTIWKSIICRFFAHFARFSRIYYLRIDQWPLSTLDLRENAAFLRGFRAFTIWESTIGRFSKKANKILPFQQAQKSAYGWASMGWFFLGAVQHRRNRIFPTPSHFGRFWRAFSHDRSKMIDSLLGIERFSWSRRQ